jgi:hypothetical protein
VVSPPELRAELAVIGEELVSRFAV